MTTHTGYIALLGRPNAGKSTLLNAAIGQKIVGVSSKPQTTRTRILGVATDGDTQMLFLDTPGLHRTGQGQKLHSVMKREAWSVVAEADLICYLVDVGTGWDDEDRDFLSGILEQAKVPLLIIGSQIDRVKKEQAEAALDQISAAIEELKAGLPAERAALIHDEIFPLSAKRPDSVAEFRRIAREAMPEGEWLFSEDDLTDRTQRFVVQEFIREQVFRCLGQELPYQSAVRVDTIEEKPKTVVIYATVIVAKASHKGMVVGRQGAKIKEIGAGARENLERHFERKVFLDLQVQVDERWLADEGLIAQYLGVDP